MNGTFKRSNEGCRPMLGSRTLCLRPMLRSRVQAALSTDLDPFHVQLPFEFTAIGQSDME